MQVSYHDGFRVGRPRPTRHTDRAARQQLLSLGRRTVPERQELLETLVDASARHGGLVISPLSHTMCTMAWSSLAFCVRGIGAGRAQKAMVCVDPQAALITGAATWGRTEMMHHVL